MDKSASMKPLVLLDVDGVVNAYPDDGSERHRFSSDGYRIIVSDETVEALRAVFCSAEDVLWLTAWRETANNEILAFLRRMGVTEEPELGVISDGHTLASGGFTTKWKFYEVQHHEQVRAALAEGREVYWIEDFGWGIEGHHSAAHYCDLHEIGVTGIDTAKAGKLLLTHLEGTPFQAGGHG